MLNKIYKNNNGMFTETHKKWKLIYIRFAMLWKYRAQFKAHKQTIKLAEKLLKQKAIVWNENDLFLILSICIMAMTITKMQSIRLLCRNGLGKDAAILLRVVFEDIVNFNYIDNDKKRVKDFMDYDTYERLKVSKWAPVNIMGNPAEYKARVSELEKIWDKVKQKYTYTTPNGKNKIFDRWSGKNLLEMAKELKGEGQYNFLYRYLSTYVHFTSTTFNDYVLGAEKNNIVIEIGLSHSFIPEVLISSSALVLDSLIKVININYKLGLDKEIEDSTKKVVSLKGSSRIA